MSALRVIPPMTDPLGRYWQQPRLDEILVDEVHALMSEAAVRRLSEYSTSIPTGTYLGKMWKMERNKCWYLRWYDRIEADQIYIETREIVIL